MTERLEGDRRAQVGRILSIMGELLNEAGGLVQGEPAESRAVAPQAASIEGDRADADGPDRAYAGAELLLVCDSPQGEVAFPWSWVAASESTDAGAHLLCRITDPRGERALRLGRVLGLMTWDELVARGASVQRFFNPDELTARLAQTPASVTPTAAPAPAPTVSDPIPFPEPLRRGAIEPLPAAPAAPDGRMKPPAIIPDLVCIISPSALARRFLMRHLCDLGYEVLEARDLDDPLLPADLKGVAALFLDESLAEDWALRPAAARGEIPLVLLTVDGDLSVPRDGEPLPRQAVLPRPFERAEVERVVRWLRALRTGGADGGGTDHGNAEDDTWLFADPFGAARAGEHSSR